MELTPEEYRQAERECERVQRDADDEDRERATRLLHRRAPEGRQRCARRAGPQHGVEKDDRRHERLLLHLARDRAGEEQCDRGEKKQHHRPGVEKQGIDRETLTAQHRDEAEDEEGRGAEVRDVVEARRRDRDLRDDERTPNQHADRPRAGGEGDEDPRESLAAGRRLRRAQRRHDRAQAEREPGDRRHRASRPAGGRELLESVDREDAHQADQRRSPRAEGEGASEGTEIAHREEVTQVRLRRKARSAHPVWRHPRRAYYLCGAK